MESHFKVSCAERYTLNTGGEGKCKKQKRDGERATWEGWNCTIRVCDMARPPFFLNLSASERPISFAITAASVAHFFITLKLCPVCMSH